MRRRSLGLRPRLVFVLVATSALTLAVGAVALLAPLERQLRNDEIESLIRQASLARGNLAHVDPREAAGRHKTQVVLRALRRRANAQVFLVNRAGRAVAGTDVDPGEPTWPARRALATDRVVQEVSGQEVRIGVPVRTEGGRYGLQMHKALEDVTAAAAVVRRAVLTAALVGLGVALLVGIALAGRLVRRLRGLRDVTLKVARLGPVVEVQPDNRRDEIGDLSRAFAVMQDRLREQEEARRTFVSTASHELRTPLTSLRLMLDLLHEELGREPLDAQGARVRVNQARSLSDRLGALAGQLLDLSQLDAGVPLRQELIDLHEQARAVTAEFVVRAGESGRTLDLRGDAGVWAVGDPGAVAQVLRVLLDNALRFAPPGTAIEVTVVGGAVPALRVCDQGPGVPAEEREHIFERFRRGTHTGGQAGFGLGLAIARELARRMAGDLVLSAGDGPSCFELRLRAAPGDSSGRS